MEKLAQKVDTSERGPVPVKLAQYEAKFGRALAGYDLAMRRPQAEKTHSPEADVKLKALETRAEEAKLKFQTTLDRYSGMEDRSRLKEVLGEQAQSAEAALESNREQEEEVTFRLKAIPGRYTEVDDSSYLKEEVAEHVEPTEAVLVDPEQVPVEEAPESNHEQEEQVIEAATEKLSPAPAEVHAPAQSIPESAEALSDLEFDLYKDPLYKQLYHKMETKRPDKWDTQLRLETEREFERLNPERFKAYQEKMKTIVYRDSSGRPRIDYDPLYERLFLDRQYGGEGHKAGVPYDSLAAHIKFIERYPEKAAAYAETDSRISHLVAHLEERNRLRKQNGGNDP